MGNCFGKGQLPLDDVGYVLASGVVAGSGLDNGASVDSDSNDIMTRPRGGHSFVVNSLRREGGAGCESWVMLSDDASTGRSR